MAIIQIGQGVRLMQGLLLTQQEMPAMNIGVIGSITAFSDSLDKI